MGALALMALTKSKVSNKPTIFYGRGVVSSQGSEVQATEGTEVRSTEPGDETRGDVKIHGL